MSDLKYDARVLHNDPVTETEKEIAGQELANESLLVAPLDASICTAEYHVQTGQKEVDAVQRMLDTALAKLAISTRSCERLKSTRRIIKDSMDYNRSYFHPQRKVPAEILVQIFRVLVEQTEKERSRQMRQGVKSPSNPLKAAYRISHVCRKWHSAAASDPSLWRFILADIDEPGDLVYIKRAVDLAKGADIEVSATRAEYDRWPDMTWEALRALPPRISQVEVIVECQSYVSSINWPVECIVDKWVNYLRPGAQYAAVGLPGDDIVHVPKSVEYHGLHALLDGGDLAWMHAPTVTVRWASDVSVTTGGLVSFFQSTPHLQTLCLDWSSWVAAPTSTPPFAVGNLQRLRLNVFFITEAYTILQNIVQLPALSSLWLDFPTDKVEPLPVDAWSTFMAFNQAASATFSIHSLVLSSLQPQPAEDHLADAHFNQLLDILAGMPSVHSLTLKDSDAETLFQAMLDDTRILPILPALAELTLKRCRLQGETLVRWVKWRMPSSDPTSRVDPRPSPMAALAHVRFDDCPDISSGEWNEILEVVDSLRHE